jgi:hypothetical protein
MFLTFLRDSTLINHSKNLLNRPLAGVVLRNPKGCRDASDAAFHYHRPVSFHTCLVCMQPTSLDHAHALSEMADRAANDSAKCQSSGAALGLRAYKECRALLENKMNIENTSSSIF